jgi:hypothetical protein
MLSQVLAQQPGATCRALQAVARISTLLTRRSIAAAAQAAAAGDAALGLIEKQGLHFRESTLVSESAKLAAGCFAGAGSSQQQIGVAADAAAVAAEPASLAAAAAAATTQTGVGRGADGVDAMA